MRPLLIVLALLFSGTVVSSQPVFQKTWGGGVRDVANDVIQTKDGGFLLVGACSSIRNSADTVAEPQFCLMKTDEDGEMEWVKSYELPDGHSVVEHTEGGYLAISNDNPPGVFSDSVTTVVRTDENGELMWEKQIAGVYNVVREASGGYVMAGRVTRKDEENDPYFNSTVVKIDGTGEVVWAREYVVSGRDGQLHDIRPVVAGGYIAVGSTGATGNEGDDGLMIRVDEAGEPMWSKVYGTAEHEVLEVVREFDGGFIAGGTFFTMAVPSLHGHLLVTDFQGDTQKSVRYGDLADRVHSIEPVDDGFVIGGNTFSFGSMWHTGVIFRFDLLDFPVWYSTWANGYGTGETDATTVMIPTSDGGYALVGGSWYSIRPGSEDDRGSVSDLYFVKVNEEGNSGCAVNEYEGRFTFEGTGGAAREAGVQTLPLVTTSNSVEVTERIPVLQPGDPCSVSSVGHEQNSSFRLSLMEQPVRNELRLAMELAEEANVSIEVFNGAGKKVREVGERRMAAGTHHVVEKLTGLPSGGYHYVVLLSSALGHRERQTGQFLLVR